MNNWATIKSIAHAFDQLGKLGHLFCRLSRVLNMADCFLVVLFDLFFYVLDTGIET